MSYLKKHSDFVLIMFIFIFFGILFKDYWITDTVLTRDDLPIIVPLSKVGSITDYFMLVKNNTILDVQPVRDLSFIFNLKVLDLTGKPWFRFFNFIIFLLILLFTNRLMKLLDFKKSSICFSMLIIAMHPVMLSATGWISARKHSLAVVFLLLALISFLRDKKITPAVYLWFLLSVLSHQIFILFPVWLLIYTRLSNLKADWTRLTILAAVGMIGFIPAFLKTFVFMMGNTMFMRDSISENISRAVLSVGRAVSQLVFPVSISAYYEQGNPLNLIGIPVLILTLAMFYKKKSMSAVVWISLAAIAFAPTLFTFVNDTYLYLPLICCLISCNFYFAENPPKLPRPIIHSFLFVFITLLSVKTIDASRMWKSDYELWKYSFENEKSPYAKILLSRSIMPAQPEYGLELLIEGVKGFDLATNENVSGYFLPTVYTSNLSIQRKIEIFRECYIDTILYNSYFGLTLAEGNEAQMWEGIQLLKKNLRPEETYTEGEDGRKIYAGLKYLCKNFPGKEIVCRELNITSF